MDWINYHHLLYFWTVARTGSLAAAARELHLTPPTLSTQIRTLETALGEPLFDRRGRGLVLTDVGQVVHGYAEEIFALGRELVSVVKERTPHQPVRLAIGVADAVPKMVARRVLLPALDADPPFHVVVREGKARDLVAELDTHRLDLVVADAVPPPTEGTTFYAHPLLECGIVLAAEARLAERLRRRFPASLDGAPALLPTHDTELRRALDRYFEARGVRPRVVAEFEDPALMKAFGQDGRGFFPVADVDARETLRRHRVRRIGAIEEVRERFYALTPERRLEHPGVRAITGAAPGGG